MPRHHKTPKMFALLMFFGSTISSAENCSARFTFDGNLADSSGSGLVGQMIGKNDSVASPQFVDGRVGQALKLDGNAAMRALVDLNYEVCPQVTIAAWIRFDGDLPTTTQSIFSTGGGAGPGLRASGSTLTLNGTENGLMQHNAVRKNAGWMFVAGVYDYAAGTQTLYYRTRSVTTKLGANRRMPEDAIWVGAFNDQLSNATSDITIDDLQVIGRALSPGEINTLRVSGIESICFPDVCKGPTELPSAVAPHMPNVGADRARAGAVSGDIGSKVPMPAVGADWARAGATAPPGEVMIESTEPLPVIEGTQSPAPQRQD